jgi:hypothetical protein
MLQRMSERAITQALRRRYRGHEGRLVRKRSRELQRVGDRNVSELSGPQRPAGELALIRYEFPGTETGAGEPLDYFVGRLGGTTA